MSKILVNVRGATITRRGCRPDDPWKWELDAGRGDRGDVVRLNVEHLKAIARALREELDRAAQGDVNAQPDEEGAEAS